MQLYYIYNKPTETDKKKIIENVSKTLKESKDDALEEIGNQLEQNEKDENLIKSYLQLVLNILSKKEGLDLSFIKKEDKPATGETPDQAIQAVED